MPKPIADTSLARRARFEIAGGAALVIGILGVAFYNWTPAPDRAPTPVAGYAQPAPDTQAAQNEAAAPTAAKRASDKRMIAHPTATRGPTQPAPKQRFVSIPGLLKPLNLAPPPLLEYERATSRPPLTKAQILDRRRVRALRLARFSREHTAERNAVTGALLALEALPELKALSESKIRRANSNATGTSLEKNRNRDRRKTWDETPDAIVRRIVYRALYNAYLHRREIGVLKGHFRYVRNAVYSHDGARLATVSSDSRAHLWDPRTGAKIALLKGHDGEVWDAAFSPDDRFLATASFDGVIRIWSTDTGAERAILKGHTAEIASLDYSADGRFLVSGSYDGTARLWNMDTLDLHAVLNGHDGKLRSVAFSSSAKNPNQGELGRGNPGGGPLRVATAGDDGTARIWDAATGAELAVMRGHGRPIRRVAFSPDGAILATASADGTARLWTVADGAPRAVLRGHESWVDFIAFSPDGAQVATASRDKTARLWSAADGAPRAVLRGHESWVNTVAFSPDGALLLTGSSDWTARLWRTQDGEAFATLAGHRGELWSVAFSPDGKFAATGSGDGVARLWTIDPAAQKARIAPNAVLWSRPSNAVFTVSVDPNGRARLRHTATGADFATLPGPAKSAAFSPDGAQLVVLAPNGDVRVYDIYDTLDALAVALKATLPRALTRAQRMKYIILPNAGD